MTKQANTTGRLAASIDIGTNSVKCLVAEVSTSGLGTVCLDERVITRLGEGLHATGRLEAEPMRRTLLAVAHYAGRVRKAGAEVIRVAGTSALREASNTQDMIAAVRQMAGLDVEVLTGEEEARLAFLAVRDLAGPGEVAVVDTGGGSTEWVIGCDGAISYRNSFPVGAVRLTDAMLPGDPPTPSAVTEARDLIQLAFTEVPVSDCDALIGIGGTFQVMASVALAGTSSERPVAYLLTGEEIARQVAMYARMPVSERQAIPGMEPDRASIILGGALIAEACLARAELEAVNVTQRGLRHGLILDVQPSP